MGVLHIHLESIVLLFLFCGKVGHEVMSKDDMVLIGGVSSFSVVGRDDIVGVMVDSGSQAELFHILAALVVSSEEGCELRVGLELHAEGILANATASGGYSSEGSNSKSSFHVKYLVFKI